MKTDDEIAKQWLHSAHLSLEGAIKQAITKSRRGTKASDKLPACPWCNQAVEYGEECVRRDFDINRPGEKNMCLYHKKCASNMMNVAMRG